MEIKEMMKQSLNDVIVVSETNEYIYDLDIYKIVEYADHTQMFISGVLYKEQGLTKQDYLNLIRELTGEKPHFFWREFRLFHKLTNFVVRQDAICNKEHPTFNLADNYGNKIINRKATFGQCIDKVKEYMKDFKVETL